MHRGKVLVAGISTAVALVLAWQVYDSKDSGRQGPSPALVAAQSVGADRGARIVDETFLAEFFPGMEDKGCLYDTQAYLVRAPNVTTVWKWPEYPSGKLRMSTNGQGFREDGPTPREFPGPRVIVLGDSHTDGMVENRSSFANVAERELRAALRREVDVVNAGTGFTSPSCYLGMMRKRLELRPDVFVAVLFVGNDFLDEIGLACALRRISCAPAPEGYWERTTVLSDRFGGFNQGLNQAYRFHTFAGEAETAVSLVLDAVYAMDELCRAEGIAFLLVLLPTKMCVDDDDREVWTEHYRELGLDASLAELDLELGRRVLASAREHGIDCLDPTDAMRAAQVPLYWKMDYHLGLEGHALLGSLLAGRLREILAERGARGR